MSLSIPGPAGVLEAQLWKPPGGVAPRAAVVLCHAHPLFGGTMNTTAVFRTARGLEAAGLAVLRFNFRGVGTSAGSFDDGAGEMDDFRAALDFMHARHPGAPIWAAGMSFGAWIALSAGAADPRVSTLVGICPPLSHYDFEAVRTSTKPKFFIQGERDERCPLKEMQAFYASAAHPKELVVIDGADHLFDGKLVEVAEAIEDLLGDWHD
jgi:alpha/beta superfamily hydrolase